MASALESFVTSTIIGAMKNAACLTKNGEIDGVFSNQYIDQQGIANSTPNLECNTPDVQCLPIGETVLIDGNGYAIREKQDDGMGMTRLVLEKT